MVSSPTAQIGIVRRAKFPTKPPIIRYRDVRAPIIRYLTDPSRSVNHLVSAEKVFEQRASDTSQSPFRREDAEKSIEVIHALQAMGNKLAQYTFQKAPETQARLSLGGVDVSVRADLIVHGSARGRKQVGAAILRMTQDDADKPAAIEKRKNMGLYVATLARLQIDNIRARIDGDPDPANRLCMAIDIQHGDVFVAPKSNVRRLNDLTAACQMIAAVWPTIEKS